MYQQVKWNEVKTNKDIKGLMDKCGWFHDSVLKELHFWSGYYTDKLGLHQPVEDLDCKVRMLFISIAGYNSKVVELLFEEVVQINISPSPPNYDSIIYGATCILRNGLFYWADSEVWSPDDIKKEKESSTWICARALKWRELQGFIGPELYYGNKESES